MTSSGLGLEAYTFCAWPVCMYFRIPRPFGASKPGSTVPGKKRLHQRHSSLVRSKPRIISSVDGLTQTDSDDERLRSYP